MATHVTDPLPREGTEWKRGAWAGGMPKGWNQGRRVAPERGGQHVGGDEGHRKRASEGMPDDVQRKRGALQMTPQSFMQDSILPNSEEKPLMEVR